jgi:DNA primase
MTALVAGSGVGPNFDPMGAVEDVGQRALLAQVLLEERDSPAEDAVEGALHGLQLRWLESRQRELRAEIAAAEARGDWAEIAALTQAKLELDREIRRLHASDKN